MKHFAWILILLLLQPAAAIARPYTVTKAIQVEAGSVLVTNDHWLTSEPNVGGADALELKRVAFTLAENWTNTFTITHIYNYKLPDLTYTVITTNTWISDDTTASGYYTTNDYLYAQGIVGVTNSWSATATTNDVTLQVFDADDFEEGWTLDWNEVFVFSFSDTNDINLRLTFTAYPRP